MTLATGISKERCEKISLGYRDPDSLERELDRRFETGDPVLEQEGILVVPRAGEVLYRLKSQRRDGLDL